MAGRAALGDRGSGPQALDDGASRSRGDRGGGDAVPQRQPITRPSMTIEAGTRSLWPSTATEDARTQL